MPDTAYPPAEDHDEDQVQHDVQKRGAAQEIQRRHGIANGPQQVGEVIIKEHKDKAHEDDPHIAVHHFHQLAGGPQEAQDRAAERHHQEVQGYGDPADQQEGQPHCALHAGLLLPAEIVGEQGAAAHGHANQDGSQECHQSVGASHRRQRVRPQEAAHDQGVRDIIKLLQEVAQYHGACEQQHVFGYVSLCQVFFHFISLLSCPVQPG